MNDIPRWILDLHAHARSLPYGKIAFNATDDEGQPVSGMLTKHKGMVGKLELDMGESFRFKDNTDNLEAEKSVLNLMRTACASGQKGSLTFTVSIKENPEGVPGLISQVVKTEHQEINYLG